MTLKTSVSYRWAEIMTLKTSVRDGQIEWCFKPVLVRDGQREWHLKPVCSTPPNSTWDRHVCICSTPPQRTINTRKNQTQSWGCVYLIPETHQLFQNGGVFLQAARVEGHFQLVAGGWVARFLHAGEVVRVLQTHFALATRRLSTNNNAGKHSQRKKNHR